MFKLRFDRILRPTKREAHLVYVGETNPEWQITLENAARSLGQLKLLSLHELRQESNHYDLYILDDATIPRIPALIQKILRRQQDARIIVISNDASWVKARAAFRAGASDCIQRDNNYRALHKVFCTNLQKQLGAGCS